MTMQEPMVVYGTLGFLGLFTLVVLLACQLSLQQVRALRCYWRKLTTWQAYKQLVVDGCSYIIEVCKRKNKPEVVVRRRKKTLSASFLNRAIAESLPSSPKKSSRPEKRQRRTGVILNDPLPDMESPRERSVSFGRMSAEEAVRRKLTSPVVPNLGSAVGRERAFRKLSMPAFDSVTRYKDWSEWMIAQEKGKDK